MKEIDKLKETLEETHKLAEESVLYLLKLESLDHKKEPLIKDEKIRQCVRLWAEINEFKGKLMYSKFDDCCSFYEIESQEELLFLGRRCSNLKHATTYTIDELCGEKEEPRPVIVNGVEYGSYTDYLKSREGEE